MAAQQEPQRAPVRSNFFTRWWFANQDRHANQAAEAARQARLLAEEEAERQQQGGQPMVQENNERQAAEAALRGTSPVPTETIEQWLGHRYITAYEASVLRGRQWDVTSQQEATSNAAGVSRPGTEESLEETMQRVRARRETADRNPQEVIHEAQEMRRVLQDDQASLPLVTYQAIVDGTPDELRAFQQEIKRDLGQTGQGTPFSLRTFRERMNALKAQRDANDFGEFQLQVARDFLDWHNVQSNAEAARTKRIVDGNEEVTREIKTDMAEAARRLKEAADPSTRALPKPAQETQETQEQAQEDRIQELERQVAQTNELLAQLVRQQQTQEPDSQGNKDAPEEPQDTGESQGEPDLQQEMAAARQILQEGS